MQPFASHGGRFIVGRDRLPLFGIGDVIARSCSDIHDIPGLHACFIEFDELRIEDLSLASAAQKAELDPDTKRWYESITAKQVYRFTLANGIRFVYVFCIVDCWRSFLFPDPDPNDTPTRGIPHPGESVTEEEVQRVLS